jgi:DNA-binding PadR family transcriptional regulator
VSVREVLLQLLDEGPRHGYQLKVDFEARTGGIWPLNVGQVYTTLDRLARDGLVAGVEGDGGPQRTFRITEEGRGEVKDWVQSSTVDAAPARDDLIMKVLVAVGRGADDALAVIDGQRSALLAALQRRRRSERAEGSGSIAEELAADAVLTRVEADINWLERCEEKLRSQTPKRTRRGQ